MFTQDFATGEEKVSKEELVETSEELFHKNTVLNMTDKSENG